MRSEQVFTGSVLEEKDGAGSKEATTCNMHEMRRRMQVMNRSDPELGTRGHSKL